MRKNISIILAVAFIIISVTGIQLIINHNNHLVKHVHQLMGIIFTIAGLVHMKLNMRPLLSYVKRK